MQVMGVISYTGQVDKSTARPVCCARGGQTDRCRAGCPPLSPRPCRPIRSPSTGSSTACVYGK